MSFHFIKPDTKINFIGLRYYAFALSALMIIVGGISLVMKGGTELRHRLCRRRHHPGQVRGRHPSWTP